VRPAELKPVLRYPGSKWNIARWIVKHFPPHSTYLEPFFGSGAVFFVKPPSHTETINDINGDVVNLFRVIRERPKGMAALIEKTPWARAEYYESYERTGEALEDARRFLVRCWMARGTKLCHRTGWRNDIQGRQGTSCAKIWNSLPVRILAVAERLKQAQIENQPAMQLIERYKHPCVLIYADPPYLLATRREKAQYAHEMTDEQHAELLDALDQHPGPVLISGYDCQLYQDRLSHWKRKTTRALAEGGRRRTETLWINPVAAATLTVEQVTIFNKEG
jgi:DNA adenine methylase